MSIQDHLTHITDYLGMASRLRGGRGPEQFILDHGMACGPRVQTDLPMMEMKQCYYNSYESVTCFDVDSDEWFYCEGYAVRGSLGLPLSHAWLVNREGEVIDRTWDWNDADEEFAYFGVPFTPDYIRRNAVLNGYPSPLWSNEMFNVEILEKDPSEFRAFLPQSA